MSDATIAAIAGGILVVLQIVVVRIMDWYFPKGRMSKSAAVNSVDTDDDECAGEGDHEAQ